MQKHFGAVERTKKRYVYLFAFVGIVMVIIGIVFLVKKELLFGICALIFSVSLFVASFLRCYVEFISPKTKPAYSMVKEDYNNNLIKKELSNRGLKLDYIDAICDPNGGIKFGYYYSKNTYFLGEIFPLEYGFALDVADSMLLISADVFDKYLPKKSYGKLSKIKVKGKTNKDFYDDFVKFINDEKDKIEELDKKCRNALQEDSKL